MNLQTDVGPKRQQFYLSLDPENPAQPGWGENMPQGVIQRSGFKAKATTTARTTGSRGSRTALTARPTRAGRRPTTAARRTTTTGTGRATCSRRSTGCYGGRAA